MAGRIASRRDRYGNAMSNNVGDDVTVPVGITDPVLPDENWSNSVVRELCICCSRARKSGGEGKRGERGGRHAREETNHFRHENQ